MNRSGIIKAGLAAGLLINLSQQALSMVEPLGPRETVGFWVAYNFALGFFVAFWYALLLARGWDSGVKTAILAGLITWGVGSCANPVYSDLNAWIWSLAELSVAGVVVAMLYRQPKAAPSGDWRSRGSRAMVTGVATGRTDGPARGQPGARGGVAVRAAPGGRGRS